MPSLEKSLLDYLRSENPVINGDMCQPGANTKSKNHSWDTPRKIEVWKDFEYNSLKSIYGGELHRILECPFTFEDFSAIPRFPFREIHDEKSLESLIVKWNHSMIIDALSMAQNYLENRLSHDTIHMVRGSQARYPDSGSKLRPDWGAVKRHTTRISKPDNVLPGDTKLSKKWSSGDIEIGLVQDDYKKTDWLRPVAQIFSYCVRSNSRYGYVITNKELVVVRIRPDSQTNSQSAIQILQSSENPDPTPATRARDQGVLEYQAIPWDNDGRAVDKACEGMTVNLALWWLHMMAAEESAIAEHYTPLPGTARIASADSGNRNRRFAVSNVSSVGRRFSRVGVDSQDDQPTRKANQRGKKRLRDSRIDQINRQGKKLRSARL